MKYITRSTTGLSIGSTKEHIINKGLKQYLNELCIKNLATFEGRIEAVRNVLNIVQNVPLYINDETLLIPTKSIRECDMYYINYHRILYIQDHLETCIIVFNDGSLLEIECSYNKIQNHLKNGQLLLDYLNR